MTAMMNFRVFMSERLTSAAIEIFGEVEKIITLYQAEVTRSREEVRHLQQQLEVHRKKDHPDINVLREDPSITAIKREAGPTLGMDYEDSEHSPNANVDSPHMNTEIQTDVSRIKEEEEEDVFSLDCEGLITRTTRATFTNRDPEQTDTEFRSRNETAGLLPMCASAVTADLREEWSKQAQTQANESVLAAPPESPSAKTQHSDHSFCHLCGKPFRYIGSLMKHIKMHDDHTVNCGVCNRSCHNINDLLGHLRSAHRGSFFCHICGKTFSKQCFLIIHSKQHKGSKPFACDDWQPGSRKGAS
ncbi:hypothetical protein NHX12_031528 [Muraenolepis orangiensis]|uniref:C2H2-type domain-containing protein n=1 Tax=Muraenolepis orangiensis TaxID=630683 RepID=A0A9Q0E462_9TELE|nr:hypothetical protein NHX12_031528 [Muraenolepis orangiensis]